MPLMLAVFLWFMAIVTVLIFMARTWWPPEVASAHGGAIDDQMVLTLIASGVVFFLAQIFLGYFIWRYRAVGTERAAYWHDQPKLETTWTIATLVLFVGLGIQGNRVWASYFRAEAPPDAVTIEVTAQQFAWNIRYPGADGRFGRTETKLVNDSLGNFVGVDPKDPAGNDDIVAQNLMAIPVNRAVRIILKTKDVTHAFFVPRFRVKQDAVPGMAIPLTFTATKPGEYELACAELCGMQHYKMRGRVQVMSEAEFQGWLKSRAAAAQ
jgi:cytochrome c oxidase subunit 2